MQIHTAKDTQWKLLLEEEQSRYIFPGDSPTTVADNPVSGPTKSSAESNNKIDQDWQFVVASPTPPQITVTSHSGSASCSSDGQSLPKLFPAGISYLREMGTRKIGALKQRLSAERPPTTQQQATKEEEEEEEATSNDNDNWDDDGDERVALGTFVDVLETPSVTPEMITSAQGPKIVVQNHNTRNALFALHERHETVSVHNLNMDPEPFQVFCLPECCEDVLVTQNTIYTVQRVGAGQRSGRVGTDGVASTQTEEEKEAANKKTGGGGVEGSAEDVDVEPRQVMACGVVSKTLAIKNKEADLVSGFGVFYVSRETLDFKKCVLILATFELSG